VPETTVKTSLVHHYASMTPSEFGKSIEPKWQVASQLVENVRFAVEKKQLTPLDGARVMCEFDPPGRHRSLSTSLSRLKVGKATQCGRGCCRLRRTNAIEPSGRVK
jgi:hypothetical protein